MKKRAIWNVACLGVVIFGSAAFLMSGSAFAQLGPGDTAPDFTLDLHGTSQPVDLYNYLSGKILVFDFFAEWCGPCNTADSQLEPFVQQYYAALGGNPAHLPVQLVSINEDCSPGDAAATNAYIANYGLPLVLDDPAGTVFSEYGMGYIPQFTIVDGLTDTNHPQWDVIWTQTGYGSGEYTTFRNEINSIVPEPTSLVILGIGAVGLLAFAKRRRRV
jgi:thiol-disulfide isomerase/thioredoxin